MSNLTVIKALMVEVTTQHPFNGFFQDDQKGKPRDDGLQWYHLEHMQIICMSLQT